MFHVKETREFVILYDDESDTQNEVCALPLTGDALWDRCTRDIAVKLAPMLFELDHRVRMGS